MGLLDSVLGAINKNQAPGGGAAAAGGLGGLLAMAASNPQLVQAITGMLGNDGQHGGLSGLLEKFQQAGLGDVVASWIGKGQNQAISGDQLTSVLGSGPLAGLAEKLGMSPEEAASQISNVLPGLVDKLTPAGELPQGGVDSGDLMGMLGGLLKGR
ncbi:MAG: YidB family protein [Pseudomonadota bacterium]